MNDAVADEILYGRDHENLRVFISSRMNGTLDDERITAADAVSQVDGHRPWLWERDALAGFLHSEAECVKYAAASDGLILLLADELSPIVAAEFAAAKNSRAERYIFVKDLTDPGPPDVLAFVAEERETVVTRNFANLDELRSHIVTDLRRTQVRNHRHVQLQRISDLGASHG